VIRALLGTGTKELKFDVAANPAQTRAWTSPNCVWDATATNCANQCGPDNPCIYVQPTAIGLYMQVTTPADAIYSYASGGCGGSAAAFGGIRNWMGDECALSSALAGALWVR
jgi:hypothetical protein